MSKKVICVIGMHRSGTSAVTRVINLLGVEVGDENTLLEPQIDNPKGFWENKEIVEVNNEILRYFCREWDTTLPIQGEWWKSGELKYLKKKIKNMIKFNISKTDTWIWKDPRTSILLPLYTEIAKEIGIDINFIICVRNPIDVHNSLMKRDKFPLYKSLDVWKHYTLSALYWTKDNNRLIVHYDQLLDDRKRVISEICDFLEMGNKFNDVDIKKSINDFLSENLRHSKTPQSNIQIEDYIEEDYRSLYNAILKCLDERIPLDKNQFNKFISNMYNSLKKTKVFIWGIGEGGKKTLQLLKEKNIIEIQRQELAITIDNIEGIIDKDKNKHGEKVNNLLIYPPEILHKQIILPHILICSMYFEEIIEDLLRYGYEENDYRIQISPLVKYINNIGQNR